MVVASVGGLGAAWTLAALAAVSASALLVLVVTPGPAAPGIGQAPRGGWRAVAAGADPPGTRPLLAALLALHLLGGGAQFLLGPLLMARLDSRRDRGGAMGRMAHGARRGGVRSRATWRRAACRPPARAAAGAGLATAGAAALAPFGDLASVAAGVAALAAGIGAAVPSTWPS